jgi:hypothetical protein
MRLPGDRFMPRIACLALLLWPPECHIIGTRTHDFTLERMTPIEG